MYSLIPYVTPGSIYNQISDTIKDEYKSKKVDYAIFTGDFVWDEKGKYDWIYSEMAFGNLLRNNIPHGVLAGNHDMDDTEPITLESYKEYTKRFGENKYKDKAWYGESFYNNIGHYDLTQSEKSPASKR